MSIVRSPPAPEVTAAESLSLSCQASGGTGVYSYRWSSTCTGNCILSGDNMAAQTITRDAARAADSGVYTCEVMDHAGNNGTNSTEITIVGKTQHVYTLYRI